MVEPAEILLAAIRELARANHELQTVLDHNAQILTDALGTLGSEHIASKVLSCREVVEGQTRSDEAMTQLFDARHRLRRALVAQALHEGVPVPLLAELLGVRPDLVQAYASALPNQAVSNPRPAS